MLINGNFQAGPTFWTGKKFQQFFSHPPPSPNNKLIEFCNLFAEQTDLPMTCNVRADLMDEEVAKALAGARCNPARFAIETGSEHMRNSILEKRVNDKQIYDTVILFKKYKIPFVTFNMMGLPTETLDMAWQTIYMNQNLKPDVINIDMFMPFPNLNITKSFWMK